MLIQTKDSWGKKCFSKFDYLNLLETNDNSSIINLSSKNSKYSLVPASLMLRFAAYLFYISL